jgi:ribose 5-phosphate isomerase A
MTLEAPEIRPSNEEQLKRAAAGEALSRVRSGMRIGLGTGSTMKHFVDLLGAALSEGVLSDVVGVPTSEATAAQARALGIPLQELHQAQPLDLAVDGADEVDPALDLVKGLGGALLREKMVAQAAEHLVIIVDEGKCVQRLGTRNALPVEVVPFAWETHVLAFEEERGIEARRRQTGDGAPYRTDNGNFIIDLTFAEGIDDAVALEALLRCRAGVVETGLFLGMADEVIVASPDGISVRRRQVA